MTLLRNRLSEEEMLRNLEEDLAHSRVGLSQEFNINSETYIGVIHYVLDSLEDIFGYKEATELEIDSLFDYFWGVKDNASKIVISITNTMDPDIDGMFPLLNSNGLSLYKGKDKLFVIVKGGE